MIIWTGNLVDGWLEAGSGDVAEYVHGSWWKSAVEI